MNHRQNSPAYRNPKNHLRFAWTVCAGLLMAVLCCAEATAQTATVKVLCEFSRTNGWAPVGPLCAGPDGNFYGVTYQGGKSGNGAVFKVTTNGVLSLLASFASTNGANPEAGLMLANDGNFYGTTMVGGGHVDYGTVYRVTTNGVLTMVLDFYNFWWYGGGQYPQAALIQGTDGNFYSTSYAGGSGGKGTVYKVTTNGATTLLASFAAGVNSSTYTNTTGGHPYGKLTLGADGNFYGTAYDGGSNSFGTVFRLIPNGISSMLTSLVSFSNTNGAYPYAGLTPGGDGMFYGTTSGGGSGIYGTVFRVTTNGVLTSLASFTNGNGAHPYADLTLGNDGNLYGTTHDGGSSGNGTVFRITTSGVLTSLVSFNRTNGSNPNALTLGGDGNFYGTTAAGGSSSNGTVFALILPQPARPHIDSITAAANGMKLAVSGGASTMHRVWACTNACLASAQWQVLATNMTDTNGWFQFADTNTTGWGTKFYRVSTP